MDSNPRTPLTPHSLDFSPIKCATTPDGLFKVPKQRSISNSEKQEIIAKRTRSKISLQMIPIESIEATFQPPDITPDMYDKPEEPHWSEFLEELARPLGFTTEEEEGGDPTYVPTETVPCK